jgi:hypothetical protein
VWHLVRMEQTEAQVLAGLLYEIRLLLSAHLGSENADRPARLAAHLAYAIHNEADVIAQGGHVGAEALRAKLDHARGMVEAWERGERG